MSESTEKYLGLLDQWLKHYGFTEVNAHAESGADKVYVRGRVEATKFGKVDCYVCVKCMPQGVSGNDLRQFSEKMFSLAGRHRSGMPLGFGGMMVVYPLVVTENISFDLAGFLKTYCPKHFAAAEFPSAVDLATGYVYYYPSTPIWGYAYYNSYRRESYQLFSPKSWEEVGKKI